MTSERLECLKELANRYEAEHPASYYMKELIDEVEKLQSLVDEIHYHCKEGVHDLLMRGMFISKRIKDKLA